MPSPLPRILVARRLTQAATERARRDFDAMLAEQDMTAEEAIAAAAAHQAEALLIGPKRTKPIADGLEQAGFDMEQCHVFATLQEANDYLASIRQPEDVILYENDLPDQYTEA